MYGYLHGLLGKQCPLGLRESALLLGHVLQRLVQAGYEALEKGCKVEAADVEGSRKTVFRRRTRFERERESEEKATWLTITALMPNEKSWLANLSLFASTTDR